MLRKVLFTSLTGTRRITEAEFKYSVRSFIPNDCSMSALN